VLGWNFKAGNEALLRSACDVETARLTGMQLEESSVTARDGAARDSPRPSTASLLPPMAPCRLCPSSPAACKEQNTAGSWGEQPACTERGDSRPHRGCVHQSVLWSPAPVCSSMPVRARGGGGSPEDPCPSKGFSPVFCFKVTDLFCCKNQSDFEPSVAS